MVRSIDEISSSKLSHFGGILHQLCYILHYDILSYLPIWCPLLILYFFVFYSPILSFLSFILLLNFCEIFSLPSSPFLFLVGLSIISFVIRPVLLLLFMCLFFPRLSSKDPLFTVYFLWPLLYLLKLQYPSSHSLNSLPFSSLLFSFHFSLPTLLFPSLLFSLPLCVDRRRRSEAKALKMMGNNSSAVTAGSAAGTSAQSRPVRYHVI